MFLDGLFFLRKGDCFGFVWFLAKNAKGKGREGFFVFCGVV